MRRWQRDPNVVAMKSPLSPLFLLFALMASPGSALAAASDGYPPEALRLGLEGVTNFRAMIGTDGRAKQCEIIASSGHEILDVATCTKVIDHGRFEPARDEKGPQDDRLVRGTAQLDDRMNVLR